LAAQGRCLSWVWWCSSHCWWAGYWSRGRKGVQIWSHWSFVICSSGGVKSGNWKESDEGQIVQRRGWRIPEETESEILVEMNGNVVGCGREQRGVTF
jgi:hypothetical protein